MVTRVTIPEIAGRYGRTVRQVEYWRQRYDWPEPAGRRGRYDEFDPGEIDQAVHAILSIPQDDADPDELLNVNEAAAEAGISPGTVRANMSKARKGNPSKWPGPDGEKDGRTAWKRSTIRAFMMTKKPNKQRKPGRTEG